MKRLLTQSAGGTILISERMTFDDTVVQKNKEAKYVKNVTTNFFLHPNSIKAQHRAASPHFFDLPAWFSFRLSTRRLVFPFYKAPLPQICSVCIADERFSMKLWLCVSKLFTIKCTCRINWLGDSLTSVCWAKWCFKCVFMDRFERFAQCFS